MVLAGAIQIYSGYQLYQMTIIFSDSFFLIVGTLWVIFGLLSLCTSPIIWQQKSWVTKIIAGIGVAFCGTSVIFGYYLVVVFFAPLYWAVIDYIRTSREIQPLDWHDN